MCSLFSLDSKIYIGITIFFYRGVIQVEMRVVTFKIERDMLEIMDSICIKLKISRSEFIRDAIDYYITHEYRDKTTVPKAKVEKGVRF